MMASKPWQRSACQASKTAPMVVVGAPWGRAPWWMDQVSSPAFRPVHRWRRGVAQQRVDVLAAIGVRDAAQRRGELLQARPALGPVRLAVAAGFEPAEGCPSRAFEFCGW